MQKPRGARKPLDTDRAQQLWERARTKAVKLGFIQDAEDIAQQVLLSFIEGKGKKQSVDYAVIDAIRSLFGQEVRHGKPSRRDQEISLTNDFVRHLEAPAGWDLGAQRFFELVGLLSKEERELLTEYFYDGEMLLDMGKRRGVTESRICQRVREACWVLKRRMRRET